MYFAIKLNRDLQSKKMATIYKLTNKITGACFIGYTTQYSDLDDFEARVFTELINSKLFVRNALLYHGIVNFTLKPLFYCERKKRFATAAKFIKLYDCVAPGGYNEIMCIKN